MARSLSESIQVHPSQFAGRGRWALLRLTLVLEAWGERVVALVEGTERGKVTAFRRG